MDFTGKVVIVTGGGSGIGRATSLKFAHLNATVVIVDINEESGRKVAKEVNDAGSKSLYVKTDISNFEQTRKMAKMVHEKFDKIDILVNNAAWDKIEPFMDNDPALWDKLININLKGPIYVTRAVLEYMTKQESGGCIVNVASDAAKVGSTGETVYSYSAAKGGVYAFTKSIAQEMARDNIRANSICPGPTQTPLFEGVQQTMPKVAEAIKKAIPMRLVAKPVDQANAIVWLASKESEYITGQALSVNGGLNMC